MPANIDGLSMTTHCCFHGDTVALIEKDLAFVKKFGINRKIDIFKGLMIEITSDCNANCKLCYYPIEKDCHLNKDLVLNLAAEFKNYNIWLSGGEPTIHPDFMQIVRNMGNFRAVLSNGIKFAEKTFCFEFLGAAGLDLNGCYPAVFSFNHTVESLKVKAVENIASMGHKLNHVMFSISNVKQMTDIFSFANQFKDTITHLRIRTPFNSWAQKAPKKLYLSELSAHIPKGYKPCDDLGGNSIYDITYKKGDRYLIICSSPEISAFDVNAVQAAPKMLAHDGNVYPIPLGLIVNEGIDAGYMHYNVA
jgi:hypothetical protein